MNKFDDLFDVDLVDIFGAKLVPNPKYHDLLPESERTMEVPVVIGTRFRVTVEEATIAFTDDPAEALVQIRDFIMAATDAYVRLKEMIHANRISGDSSE